MFNIENRKKNTKKVILNLRKFLESVNPNPAVNGLIVLIFHWASVGLPLLGLFIFKLNWKFYISAFIWVLICIFHLYFNGCILTKLERNLWSTKEWYGPWYVPFAMLENIGITVTYALAQNIFIIWGVIVLIWIFIRIIFNINY